ncbi:response regulator [Haladaptatus sp. CMAA 1911]|uniref:response regulator n=1 Tax=unclassified Haladaptatus TaxID=2622732 RepID=UPI0037548760
MSEEPINVLFVDDDEQWAKYIASELEYEDPAFAVSVALSVNETILSLADDYSIDCVVSDFRMPEIDGIQMLERVQESRPNLPFILVTGEGSEDVAARAINAGVTDYLRKDPRANQAPVFVNRIRQAVEGARLRAEIRESERRYRTVIEQTRDAIVILRDEDIVFANDRFETLCESSVDTATPRSILRYVQGDDHQLVRDLVRATRSGDDPGLREVRLVRSTGEVRHCELLGDAITYENEFATLLSIRDVTLRRSRERTLKREREFNQAVQKRLVSAQTRDELESEITGILSSYGYDLVWIGTADKRGVRTRTTAGENEYITDLSDDATDVDHGGDPILWCGRTGDAQLVPDFEALMPTKRRNDALENGFRTGYAIPLRHEDISYGILAVYRKEPYRIDEAERSLLAEVAETVSFAIHHIETRQTLTSAEGVIVEAEVESDAYYLPRILSERFDHPAFEVIVNGTQVIDGDTHVQYLACSADTPETFVDVLDDHRSIRTLEVDSGEPTIYRVIVEDDTPESHLGSVGALVRSTTVTPGRATITFELSSREYLQPAMDRLNEHYAPVVVRSVVQQTVGHREDRSTRMEIDSLTKKQLFALEAAYHQGYFDRPRRHSAIDIANSLGITHTTYLQHLRVAQRKLFRQIFGGLNDSPDGRRR